jgi:hypothetical protein
MDGQRHDPAALPQEGEPVPIVHGAGRAQGRSGYVRKISPQPEFDPWTVQFKTSRYPDYAIPV